MPIYHNNGRGKGIGLCAMSCVSVVLLLALLCIFGTTPVYAAYVTTGPESQVKSGALGIIGLFKAFSGIDANSKRVMNVAVPTNDMDAATKAYVDTKILEASGGSGSGVTGITGGCFVSKMGIGTPQLFANWGEGCKPVSSDPNSQPQSCSSVAIPGYECGLSGLTCGSNSVGSDSWGDCSLWTQACVCIKDLTSVTSGSTSGGCFVRKSENSAPQSFANWGEGCKPVSSDPNSQPQDCSGVALPGYECGMSGLTCSAVEETKEFCADWTKACICVKD